MIVFKHSGDFKNTERFLNRAQQFECRRILDAYGKEGVNALAAATPTDSGKTASSWGYIISVSKGSFSISWTNSNTPDDIPIALLIQYGHGTRNGGYVQGRDYINPALKQIFDKLANDVWKEINSL